MSFRWGVPIVTPETVNPTADERMAMRDAAERIKRRQGVAALVAAALLLASMLFAAGWVIAGPVWGVCTVAGAAAMVAAGLLIDYAIDRLL